VNAQRGFSLVEVLVASAIAFALGWALLSLLHVTSFAATRMDARLRARDGAARLTERLESDAGGAWSVFVPPQDVAGASNADGHELDFVTEDASHRSYWWAYGYDAASSRVTAFAYAPGAAPVSGETFDGIASFSARQYALSALAKPASRIYDPLFAGAQFAPVDVVLPWGAPAAGGNRLVRVHLGALGSDRTLTLASATAPTHFTVIVDYTPAP
jgi:type II secretory pathway pseudopilin PulG